MKLLVNKNNQKILKKWINNKINIKNQQKKRMKFY